MRAIVLLLALAGCSHVVPKTETPPTGASQRWCASGKTTERSGLFCADTERVCNMARDLALDHAEDVHLVSLSTCQLVTVAVTVKE